MGYVFWRVRRYVFLSEGPKFTGVGRYVIVATKIEIEIECHVAMDGKESGLGFGLAAAAAGTYCVGTGVLRVPILPELRTSQAVDSSDDDGKCSSSCSETEGQFGCSCRLSVCFRGAGRHNERRPTELCRVEAYWNFGEQLPALFARRPEAVLSPLVVLQLA